MYVRTYIQTSKHKATQYSLLRIPGNYKCMHVGHYQQNTLLYFHDNCQAMCVAMCNACFTPNAYTYVANSIFCYHELSIGSRTYLFGKLYNNDLTIQCTISCLVIYRCSCYICTYNYIFYISIAIVLYPETGPIQNCFLRPCYMTTDNTVQQKTLAGKTLANLAK